MPEGLPKSTVAVMALADADGIAQRTYAARHYTYTSGTGAVFDLLSVEQVPLPLPIHLIGSRAFTRAHQEFIVG
jgi:hypothetical protein